MKLSPRGRSVGYGPAPAVRSGPPAGPGAIVTGMTDQPGERGTADDDTAGADDGEAGGGRADGRGAAEGPETLVCARCGATAPGPQPTWTLSVERGTRRHFCAACSREHLRSIEGRLDSAWW
ncbi:hypothetical protein DN402_12340 [Streptomyces sp. SW4]|nr:hypothetical protein DN402_12340 [Streptomyces sp. SW4]